MGDLRECIHCGDITPRTSSLCTSCVIRLQEELDFAKELEAIAASKDITSNQESLCCPCCEADSRGCKCGD